MADETQGEKWRRLAVAAQSGDKRSYALLLQDILPLVERRLAGGVANLDWVDDITQDVLISVHKSLSSYSPDRPFTPWLMAIIQFRKTDFLRKHYRVKKLKEERHAHTETFQSSVTNSIHAGELKDVEKALNMLPDKQQKIFKMIRIEGHSMQDVADKMDMSVSAVKVSVHRATHKLRDILE